MTNFESAFRALLGVAPPLTKNKNLEIWWDRPVSQLVQLEEPLPLPGQAERDRIFSLLLLAMAFYYFNGNKYGRRGIYPWNESARPADGRFLDSDYLGHNIAALAVNGRGQIIDFDFNHNAVFNSSAQHAETRLVRRLFALAQIQEASLGAGAKISTASLRDVTVYTSLESCAQCSGVMALAQVKRVVYLQTDPGTYWIGRILRNLTDDALRAPLPVAGSQVGLAHFGALDDSYSEFCARIKEKPFFSHGPDDPKPEHTPSITSFLCTKVARDTFRAAAEDFELLTSGKTALREPTFVASALPGGLSNAEALRHAGSFLSYACSLGRRGTPHGS